MTDNNDKTIDAYPLTWPEGRPRAGIYARSAFDTSMEGAQRGLMDELRLLGATGVILSTNIPLRRDGLPYTRYARPADVGVAVYFNYKKDNVCFACDRWDNIGDNIQAIRKTIEALRGIARWGTGDMLQAAFKGFLALPAPRADTWREVLEVSSNATREEIDAAYRRLARNAHPDHGGSNGQMAALNTARAEGRRWALS